MKTWDRCRSIGSSSDYGRRSPGRVFGYMSKSKSWAPTNSLDTSTEGKRKKEWRVAPEGCFTVYVGADRQRFVIKTECVNHPLFKLLLEEAELEYGFNSEGPLALPCDVDLFYKVLSEMDGDEIRPAGCKFTKSHSSYCLLSPSNFHKVHGSPYSLLSPTKMVAVHRIR
ncbi:hypothetical protein Syun_020202 [Stephania yunnanensis]|uniref:Small auxin up regulated protein n=1 Tax=Stephania yunnanensis TaxID=152371 RepID=A0AAP0IDR6_9MAGN